MPQITNINEAKAELTRLIQTKGGSIEKTEDLTLRKRYGNFRFYTNEGEVFHLKFSKKLIEPRPKTPNNNSVDHRAEKLWGNQESKRILKVCHYFSHGNNIVRMGKHNEYMCDIENAVADLISLLSKDTFHFTELEKIIK